MVRPIYRLPPVVDSLYMGLAMGMRQVPLLGQVFPIFIAPSAILSMGVPIGTRLGSPNSRLALYILLATSAQASGGKPHQKYPP